jgi:hypothetical protein
MRKSFVVLIASTILLTLFNIPKVGLSQTPFQMPYKTFPVQPYSYAGSVITNGSIKYLSLPSDSLPMGIVYDNKTNKVWIALNWNRSIAVIDVVTKIATVYPMPWNVDDNYYGPLPWALALTPDNCIWFTIGYMVTPNQHPEYKPFLGKLDTTNNIIYIYYVPLGGWDIKFDGNYIWIVGGGLAKIDYISETVLEYYRLESSTVFMTLDSNYIWISNWAPDGIVYRFNTITKTFDLNLTGFDRPLGLYADSDYLYVAENSWKVGTMGTIAKVNKATLEITRLNTAPITNAGPYNVLKDSYGYLWFTDHSYHVGIVGGLYYNAPKYCYFMTEVPNGSIWFSAVGSAYIGMKETGTLGKTDINRDGRVDTKDVSAVCKQFGKSVPPAPVECDMNNDGIVDTRDISMVCRNFGKTL